MLTYRSSACGSGPTYLERLGADGGRATRFGCGGRRRLDPGASVFALDGRDRVLVLGGPPAGDGASRHPHSWVARLRRFSAKGDIDPTFGRRGAADLLVPGLRSSLRKLVVAPTGGIETRFGAGSSALLSDALSGPRGHLLLVGAATSPSFSGVGFALARYRLSRK